MNDKIHFDDFAEQVALETGFDMESAKAYIYALFESIIEENEKGESVKIRNFGSFKPVYNKERRVVNPQTAMPMTVPAHYHIHFSPSQTLSSIVNAPYSHLSATRISEVKSNMTLYAIIAGVLLLAGIASYFIFGGSAEKPLITEEPAIEAVVTAEATQEEPSEPVATEADAAVEEPKAMVDEVLEDAQTGEPEAQMATTIEPEAQMAASVETPRYPGGKYRVNQSDTLYNISEILYSNAHFWPAIFGKNKEGIDDPDLIYPNTPLKIPARPDITNAAELAELDMDYVSAYKRYKAIGKPDKALWLLYTGCIKFDKKIADNPAVDPEDRKTIKKLLKRFDP